jgi:hypothetical protein
MMRTIPLLPYIIVQNNNFSYDLEQPSGNQKLMVKNLEGRGKKICSVEYTVWEWHLGTNNGCSFWTTFSCPFWTIIPMITTDDENYSLITLYYCSK